VAGNTDPQGTPAVPKPTPPSLGAPTDALVPLAAAVYKSLSAEPAGDPNVARAFALGWQMAELNGPQRSGGTGGTDGRLPGISALSAPQRRSILIKQISAGIALLADAITKAGLPAPSLAGLEATPATATVDDVHFDILATLTAADFRLGKAYGLGRALADTCRRPTDQATLAAELEPHRIANLLGWLDELSSALPPHAAGSVSRSLRRWCDVAASNTPVPRDTLLALRRAGELWRALLSGEKRADQVLRTDDYLDAARGLATQTRKLAWSVVKRFWGLTLLVAVLFVLGVVLLVVVDSSASIVAGAASLAASAGLTWKGLGGAAGKLVGHVEQPLWGAQLDAEIADAITLLPAAPPSREPVEATLQTRRDIALAIKRSDLPPDP
jgi:hypothetical protein